MAHLRVDLKSTCNQFEDSNRHVKALWLEINLGLIVLLFITPVIIIWGYTMHLGLYNGFIDKFININKKAKKIISPTQMLSDSK